MSGDDLPYASLSPEPGHADLDDSEPGLIVNSPARGEGEGVPELLDAPAHGIQHPLLPEHIEEPVCPPLLATPARRLASLLGLFICTVIASGPVTAFPALEPLLVEYGVFNSTKTEQAEKLTSVYDLGTGLGTISLVLQGPFFDWLGAKYFAPGGALVAGLGLLGMWVSVQYSHLNWLLRYAFPVTVIGSTANSFSLYSFIWLYPNHQTMVLGLAHASQLISDTAPFFIGLFDAQGWLSFPDSLLFLAVGCGLVAVVSSPFCPSKSLELQFAAYHTKTPAKQPVRPNLFAIYGRVCRAVAQQPVSCALFELWCMVNWLTLLAMASDVYFLDSDLFGAEKARNMLEWFALIYGAAGFLAAVCVGRLCDFLGLRHFFTLQCLLLSVTYAFSFTTTVQLQYVAVFCLSVALASMLVTMPNFAVCFAPPDLFGALFGSMFAAIGVVNVTFGPQIPKWEADLPGLARYTRSTVYGLCITALLGVALRCWWSKRPPPKAGSVTA
eukprot:g23387.t1